MRKIIALGFLLLALSLCINAQEEKQQTTRDMNVLKALSWGVGLPIEMRDLPGAGASFNVGYDCAYPINDRLALGFYLTGGGGYWEEFKKFRAEDNTHVSFRLTAGLMMAIGDRADKPYLLGVAPCTGFGLYDMDMTLPVEVRFGRYLNHRWYLMGELTYHISLAGETATLEPAIRVGCNFGRKIKDKK